MISNLKAKLNLIARDNTVPQQHFASSDALCSTYVNRYTLENLKRDYPLANLPDVHIASAHNVFRQRPAFDYCLNDIVFFDTETTGLSHGVGTLAFLIGLGYYNHGEFVVEQFLMKDYCQERDMLEKLVDKLNGFKIAVSFNGKSFDVPIINNRSIINRIMQPIDKLIHWDLLYPSRRMYKARLQSCSLKSIESHILGFERCGDIPGAEIPEVFFNFVKYNHPELMDIVIKHNMMDILSLFVLLGHLCNCYENPECLTDPLDIYSLARIFEQDGRHKKAQQCYISCCAEVKQAYLMLAFISKRSRDFVKAIEYFDIYSSLSMFSYIPDIEASKICEHHILDYPSAMLYAERARQKLLGRGAVSLNKQELDSINKRLDRIKIKMKRKAGGLDGGKR